MVVDEDRGHAGGHRLGAQAQVGDDQPTGRGVAQAPGQRLLPRPLALADDQRLGGATGGGERAHQDGSGTQPVGVEMAQHQDRLGGIGAVEEAGETTRGIGAPVLIERVHVVANALAGRALPRQARSSAWHLCARAPYRRP